MYDAHKGRGIESAHFDRVVQIVVDTMNELNVSLDLIIETKDLLQSLDKEILKD